MAKKRIGPRMREAAAYVALNPGCAILPVAEHVGANGPRRFGYAIVHRAIDAGLIRAERGLWRYELFPPLTDLGGLG